jgi:hypothetical protein
MSHVVSINTEIRDIEAVKAACLELGLVFKEGQTSIRWYGKWVGDYDAENAAYKLGIKPEQYGTCDHAIEVPGCKYDIGLLKNPATGGYKIYFDFWGEGQKIQTAIGEKGGKLMQHYNVSKATMALRAKGHMVQRKTSASGNIKLVVTGAGL